MDFPEVKAVVMVLKVAVMVLKVAVMVLKVMERTAKRGLLERTRHDSH